MRNRILTILALAVAFALGWLASAWPVTLRAQTQDLTEWKPQLSTPIPIESGSIRGFTEDYLVFEDKDGTIRVVPFHGSGPGIRFFTEVRRQFPADRK